MISSSLVAAQEDDYRDVFVNTDKDVIIEIDSLNFPQSRDLDRSRFNIFRYLGALDFTSYDMRSVYLSTTNSDDWNLRRNVGPLGPVTNGRLSSGAWARAGTSCNQGEYVAAYVLKEFSSGWFIDSTATGNNGFLFVQLWYKTSSSDNINFENYWTQNFNGYYGYACIQKVDPTPPELFYTYYCNIDNGGVWSADDSSQSFRCPTGECANRQATNGLISMTYSSTQSTSRLTSDLCAEQQVFGCTDPQADNYDSRANADDGSCRYPSPDVLGCTDSSARNYNSQATQNDGSCEYDVFGCTDSSATNYNSQATVSDGSCRYEGGNNDVLGCTDPLANNFNPQATQNDGSCVWDDDIVFGCTSSTASNYNSQAQVDDGSCEWSRMSITTIIYIVGGVFILGIIILLVLPTKKGKRRR